MDANNMFTSKSIARYRSNEALLGVVCHHILDLNWHAKVVLLEVDLRRRSVKVPIGQNLLSLQHHDNLDIKVLATNS
jgi:hypothetical protein